MPWYLHCRTTVILFMGWHSLSPSVIKRGTAVTLQHPKQTGWDNEPLSQGSAQGAGVGRGSGGGGGGGCAGRSRCRRRLACVASLDWAQGCCRLTHSRLSVLLDWGKRGFERQWKGLRDHICASQAAPGRDGLWWEALPALYLLCYLK